MSKMYTNIQKLFIECPLPKITQDDVAVILCTSGTTGPSKGAAHTHKSFLGNIFCLSNNPFTYPAPNFVMTKATHISGVVFPLAILAAGKTVIAVHNCPKDEIFRIIRMHKVV